MKKFRKLIPALCMLLVSALFVGTSTYAWFSMNTQVKASNMSVTAKSDTVFLQIKGQGDQAYSATGKADDMSQVALYPVSHAQKTIDANTFGVEAINKTNLEDVNSWWYGYSATSDSSVLVNKTASKVAAGQLLGKYVVKKTFDVNITASSGLETASDLKIGSVTFGAGETQINKGVRVIIAGENGLVEFNGTDADGADTVIAQSIPKDTKSTAVDVYIFIDGEDTTTMTDNAQKLFGSIEFTLTCTAAEAN